MAAHPAAWGCGVLVWNERLTEVTPFAPQYESLLLTFSTDYAQVDHRQVGDAQFAAFFGSDGYQYRTFPNQQPLDWPGLAARLRSSSYTPGPDAPSFEPMMAALAALFQAHEVAGLVEMPYETQLYFGRLD